MRGALTHLKLVGLCAVLLAASCQPSDDPGPGPRRAAATTAAARGAAQRQAALPPTATLVSTTVPTATPAPTATAAPTATPEPTTEPIAQPAQATAERAAAPSAVPQAPVVASLAGGVVQRAAGFAGSCTPNVQPGLALPAASSARPLAPGEPGLLRPVVVQIDNAAPARPPIHLSEAAAVYEYVAEGGVTRFSAVFDKEDVGVVGPVRSARLISLEIARQFDALLVYHGASVGVQNRIWNGGIYFVSFNAPDSFNIHSRLADRPVPHNSISTLPNVRGYAQAHRVPLRVSWWPDYPRGEAPTDGGTPTTQAAVGFSGPDGAPWADYRAEFRYMPEQNRYLRSIGGRPHVDAATREQISAETVVVQVAPVVVTDIVEDIFGSLSLDYQLQGEGTAYFLRSGQRWQGCWRRPGPFEPTTYYGPDGTPFPFGPGPVWIAEASPVTPLTWVG